MSEKPEKQQQLEKLSDKIVEGTVRIRAAAKSTSSAGVRIRKIQHSPVADRKSVRAVRKTVRALKRKAPSKKGDSSGPRLKEVPFVTAVK
jgi:hypothetical protein